MIAPRYRMLALDIDGTLLDRSGNLLPSTAAAVARAAEAGIRPILCTGRRYRRAMPVAEQLGINAPIVCNSGAIVKNPADHATLWRADLDPSTASTLIGLFQTHRQPMVSYTDRDPGLADFLVCPRHTNPYLVDYVSQNPGHSEYAADWAAEPLFHVCAVGPVGPMRGFERIIQAELSDRVRVFVQRGARYLGVMCEVIRRDAGKWAAVLHVAEQWGIAPDEIVAVGDDVNDLTMIEGAGLGVAMGHAPPEVLAVADHITGDHDNDGVSMLVDQVLLK